MNYINSSIHTREGYMLRFYEVLPLYNSCRLAYEVVEQEHIQKYGHHKYSEYISFRVAKHRHMKKHRPLALR